MLGALIFLAAEAAQPVEEMLLVCEGSTLTNLTTATTTARLADNQGYAVDGRASTSEPRSVDYTVHLRIRGSAAEMTVPALVMPEFNSSKSGWLPVKQLVISENEITGRVRYNFLSSSTFRIDRRTGDITSSGGFRGKCRKQDLTQRAF